MGDGTPALEVGFIIDPGGSFSELEQLQALMNSTEVRVAAEAAKIERSTSGMVKLAAAKAAITSFGNAATRELQAAARDTASVERAGERLVTQLERQNASFGKTREELRRLRAEEAAVAADRVGNTDLAQRLRAQEQQNWENEYAASRRAAQEAQAAAEDKTIAAQRAIVAAEREAVAVREAADAYRLFEAVAKQRGAAYRAQEAEAARVAAEREAAAVRKASEEHARLAALVRGSQAAQEADAVAAERLRESTDPLYAATKRLNAEIAESERLYRAGATPQAEYARQQDVLTSRLRQTGQAHEALATATGKSSFALKQTAIQIPDIVQGLLTGQHPMTIFIQQGGQIAQIGMMAEGGLKGFAGQLGAVALRLLPFAAAAAVAGVAIHRWQEQINDDAGVKKFAEGLGLTHQEMKKLGDTSVTTGDLMKGAWKTISDGFDLKGTGKRIIDYLFGPNDAQEVGGFIASIYGAFVGGYNGIIATWKLLPAALQDLFVQAANGAIGAVNWLVNKVVDGVNALGGNLSHVNLAPLQNNFVGAASAAAGALTAEVKKATAQANVAIKGVFGTIATNAQQAARDRLTKKADEIKAGRTPKVDHHAEQLARETEAIEAQIRNLYRLADAYEVSGAAALIAEARVKAESQAIKQRGDIEAAVARQVRLAIAQRVSDAEKGVAASRDQAAAQEQVNALVAAGLAPAERAGELVRDRMADLSLLAAIEAAQQVNDARGASEATKTLEAQRAARERLTRAETEARYNAGMTAGKNRLDELREELRLIGATDEARARSLAELKAQQDLVTMPELGPEKAAGYVKLQGDIAVQTVRNTLAQDAYNGALTLTADKWEIIAGKVQSAASGMADAFGAAGRAIGDVASIYATFNASRERAEDEHRKAVRDAGSNETLIAQANARFALRSSGAQIEAYGDMAVAAKGFFKEGSAGYQALGAVEKAYRVAQLAMSLQSMVQNAAETLGFVTGSAARATAAGAEGIAHQAKLPFPANIAAMAATAVALVAAGVAVFGGGGGSAAVPPPSPDTLQKAAGTGTVLGSSNTQSTSIKNALDEVAKNTDGVLQYSNQMLSSLKSIDASISALTTTIARQLNVSGAIGDTSRLNLGSSGSSGFLGIGASSTTRSLYDAGITLAATTVGDIIANGIAGQTYQVVEQIKKKSGFLGIGGGTKTSYQTTTGALPTDVAASIQSVIGALETGIVTAAGEIGVNGAKAMLDSFTVNIGKLSFDGLDAQGIQDELNAVFSSVGDQMVTAIVPDLGKFQKAGEGLFETLERVASTVSAVDNEFQKLGRPAGGIDVAMGIASRFDSASDFTAAADSYFEAYYSQAEQTAAKTAEMTKALGALGLIMPDTLAGYRQLVDAQDVTTAAGQQTYATLLQLAPAFSDLKTSMEGVKSAADILSEQQDLQMKLLQLTGDTAAIRAAELAKIDPSNRALQQQIYAIQDAQDAAKAADSLRQAWKSVGDTIMDEVRRIRGLTAAPGGSFASLAGQFNGATEAATRGDQDAAKSLPGLSQALLAAAAQAATSRQELDRIQAQTAASLEATYNAISALAGASPSASLDTAAAAAQAANGSTAANDDTASEIAGLRADMAVMSTKLTTALTEIAGNTGRTAKKWDDVTGQSGGDAIAIVAAAA